MAEGNIQALDVREAVNAVLVTLESALVAKRLDSVIDIPPDVRIAADPVKFGGILRTLLGNAVEYTQAGGHVMLDVGYPEDMPDDVVMLRVGDSGRGIPAERQERIFEASPHSSRDVERDGPGLATSRAWAREMGGDLRVRSDDRGSVFTLKLPRALDAS